MSIQQGAGAMRISVSPRRCTPDSRGGVKGNKVSRSPSEFSSVIRNRLEASALKPTGNVKKSHPFKLRRRSGGAECVAASG